MRIKILQLVLERPDQLYSERKETRRLILFQKYSIVYLQEPQRLFRDRKRFGRIYPVQAESKG
jgi:hypothetical protein